MNKEKTPAKSISNNKQLLIRLSLFAIVWSLLAWGLSSLMNIGPLQYRTIRLRSDGILPIVVILCSTLICIIELLIRKRISKNRKDDSTPILIRYSIDKLIAAIARCSPPILYLLYYKQSLESIGFVQSSIAESLLIGLLLGAGYMLLNGNSFNIWMYKKKHFNSVFRAIITGSNEEFIFRGFLQTRLISWIGVPSGWFMSSAVFSLWHYPQEKYYNKKGWLESFAYPLRTLPISLMLGGVYYFTGSIVTPVVLHLFINLSAELPKNYD